ncbi:MAG TPA: GrrA/OscA1 family cyclophane-containing rSAM-modified RiPP [Reyranella sp.]|nr:GrrA/OscA1 family cyclophane-containing rSAM-modified RiPP [Reyranella sp.]
MTDNRRSFRTLARLLPTGVLGLSIGLAAAAPQAATSAGPNGSVAARLKAIRASVSDVVQDAAAAESPDDPMRLAWWGNWHNGGWHNGGWGNGGWHNWGNGWHNW